MGRARVNACVSQSDLLEEIGALAGFSPVMLRHLDESSAQRTFLAIRAQPRIEHPNVSFGSRLRHVDDQILRGANFFARLHLTTVRPADEQNIEIGAIAELVSAKFSESNHGQLLARQETNRKEQASFR